MRGGQGWDSISLIDIVFSCLPNDGIEPRFRSPSHRSLYGSSTWDNAPDKS